MKHLLKGETALIEGMGINKILELCGNNLNNAPSWEIQGQILFKGSDGKWYEITTNSTISLASPEFAEGRQEWCRVTNNQKRSHSLR